MTNCNGMCDLGLVLNHTCPNPTYKNIKGYAELIRICYDRTKVTYADILDMFFAYHTPANPRFAGSQYRSATFYLSQDQRQATEEKTKVLGALWKFVTIDDSLDFYRAEKNIIKSIWKSFSRTERERIQRDEMIVANNCENRIMGVWDDICTLCWCIRNKAVFTTSYFMNDEL